MDAFEKVAGTVRSRRPWLRVVAFLWFVVALLLPFLLHPLEPWLPAAGIGFSGLGAFVAIAAWFRWPRALRGRLSADPMGLYVDGRRVAARRWLAGQPVQLPAPHESPAVVRFWHRWMGLIDVAVDERADAEALVGAMRLDATSSLTRMTFANPRWGEHPFFLVALLGLLGMLAGTFSFRHHLQPFAILVPTFIIGLLVTKLSQVTVEAGADGITVRRLLARPRFIRHADLDEVVFRPHGFSLRLKNGSRIELSRLRTTGNKTGWYGAAQGKKTDWYGAAQAEADSAYDAFVACVRSQRDAYERRDVPFAPSALARGGRQTAEWLRGLRNATELQATFRTSSMPQDALLAIVEDPSAAPSARAGAAVALKASFSEDARIRVHAAAGACAEPRLRVALDAIAEASDDAALVFALESIDETEQRARQI